MNKELLEKHSYYKKYVNEKSLVEADQYTQNHISNKFIKTTIFTLVATIPAAFVGVCTEPIFLIIPIIIALLSIILSIPSSRFLFLADKEYEIFKDRNGVKKLLVLLYITPFVIGGISMIFSPFVLNIPTISVLLSLVVCLPGYFLITLLLYYQFGIYLSAFFDKDVAKAYSYYLDWGPNDVVVIRHFYKVGAHVTFKFGGIPINGTIAEVHRLPDNEFTYDICEDGATSVEYHDIYDGDIRAAINEKEQSN